MTATAMLHEHASPQPPAPLPPLDEEMCWEAVDQRRSSSDGLFFVAVRRRRSTAARRAPRARRCARTCASSHGRRVRGRGLPRLQALPAARPRVRRHAGEAHRAPVEETGTTPTLIDLSAEFGVSQFHLQRTFKRVMGLTPRIRRRAAHRAAQDDAAQREWQRCRGGRVRGRLRQQQPRVRERAGAARHDARQLRTRRRGHAASPSRSRRARSGACSSRRRSAASRR